MKIRTFGLLALSTIFCSDFANAAKITLTNENLDSHLTVNTVIHIESLHEVTRPKRTHMPIRGTSKTFRHLSAGYYNIEITSLRGLVTENCSLLDKHLVKGEHMNITVSLVENPPGTQAILVCKGLE